MDINLEFYNKECFVTKVFDIIRKIEKNSYKEIY